MSSGTRHDGLSHAAQDQRRDERRVEGADAVDDGLRITDGFEDAGIGRWSDFLAVGVDVPDAGDAGGEILVFGFGELDVFVAQGGQRAWWVVVFVGVRVGGVGICEVVRAVREQ